jgi:hypothetical protein
MWLSQRDGFSMDKIIYSQSLLDVRWFFVGFLNRLQAKVNAVRELQSTSGEELSALMPSILDRAFKGEL